jgi:ketosteroid isomerase-like protein
VLLWTRSSGAHRKQVLRNTARALSEENVEIVRSALAASDRTLDEVAEYWDPDIDWRAIEGAPDDIGVFKGHEAMRRYYGQWYETFDDLAVQSEELIDCGEQVVAAVRVKGRMKGSDAAVDMSLGIVYTVKDGLIVRGREYASREEALAAIGAAE